MVPLSSVRISRVPTYSGSCSLFQNFIYGGFTRFALPFQVIRLFIQIRCRSPYPARIATHGLGSSDFARHYFRNHCCFLFLRVLRCFSSPGSLHIPMDSVYDNAILLALSSLIRISTDHWIFAPPRSFSQLVTSFFGAMYQGILRKPFVAWSISLIFLLVSYKNSITFTRLIRFFHSFEDSLKSPYVFCAINQLALLFLIWKFCLLYSSFINEKQLSLLCSCESSSLPQQQLRLFATQKRSLKRQLKYNITSKR